MSERRNRTLMEMARCLLYEKKLPLKFWAEAVSTASYILNRLSSKSIGDTTPFEEWFGTKPKLDHVRIFGSPCYVLQPEMKRRKLDQKAEIEILIGYSSKSSGYKVYDLKSNQAVIARNVKFAEDQTWNWETGNIVENRLNRPVEMEESTEIEEVEDQSQEEVEDQSQEEEEDHPVRGTRLLSNIYSRCNLAATEPTNVEEAMGSKTWVAAMKEEINMIEKNETWTLVDRPKHRKVIGVRWIYKTKLNSDGSINKNKARLVVKGYAQEQGIDYQDTFAPVSRMDTIKLLLMLASQKGWLVWQMDVKSAFLNGTLDEEIYVEQPEGFENESSLNKVYLLKKALYGLKQAPRAWYSKLDEYLSSLGFEKSLNEATLYVKKVGNQMIIISVYVDDLLITGNNDQLIDEFKRNMKSKFEMNDLGLLAHFFGYGNLSN